MPISSTLKAAAFASIAAMGSFALMTGTPAFADHHAKAAEANQPNIVETAMGTGVHATLVAAVKAADLVETLSAPGPYTVFAPTDDAFAALPAGTVDTLLKPENKDQLTSILTYHVVGSTALSTDLMDGMAVTTLNGEDVTVTINTDGVFINDAQVTMADIAADNGVVHVIDAVLLPPTDNVEESKASVQLMPNPATDVVRIGGLQGNARSHD